MFSSHLHIGVAQGSSLGLDLLLMLRIIREFVLSVLLVGSCAWDLFCHVFVVHHLLIGFFSTQGELVLWRI